MTSAMLQFAGSHAEGFQSQIPEDVEKFEGKPIGIWVESIDDGSCPDPNLVTLLDEILHDLSSVIEAARAALSRYEDSNPEYLAHIKNPHIWLTVDLIPSDPSAWTFVVERDDWPDFGWHVEFRGTRFHEIWAGS